MQLLTAKNVFESFKFLYNLNKLCGYLFFTISKDRLGKYSSKTTAKDFLLFAASIAFSIYGIYRFIGSPVIGQADAIIIYIGLFLISKLMIIQPLFNVLHNFIKRKKMFQILYNFNFIDEKVSSQRLW